MVLVGWVGWEGKGGVGEGRAYVHGDGMGRGWVGDERRANVELCEIEVN